MFGVDKATINRILLQFAQMSETQQDFTPPITNFAHLGEIGKDFTPPIYNIWNLAKQDNATDSHRTPKNAYKNKKGINLP